MMLDLASIPTYEDKNKDDETEVVSPENEANELRKSLGL